MKVKEFMTSPVHTGKEDWTIKDAASFMCDKNISALPIVDAEGKLSGIITESDFVGKSIDVPHTMTSVKKLFGHKFFHGDIEGIFEKAKNELIEKIMTKNPKTVSPDDELSDVVNFMITKHFKRIPVVENGNLVGIVTRRDILKAFQKVS